MKSTFKALVLTTLALALNACGRGGGGDNVSGPGALGPVAIPTEVKLDPATLPPVGNAQFSNAKAAFAAYAEIRRLEDVVFPDENANEHLNKLNNEQLQVVQGMNGACQFKPQATENKITDPKAGVSVANKSSNSTSGVNCAADVSVSVDETATILAVEGGQVSDYAENKLLASNGSIKHAQDQNTMRYKTSDLQGVHRHRFVTVENGYKTYDVLTISGTIVSNNAQIGAFQAKLSAEYLNVNGAMTQLTKLTLSKNGAGDQFTLYRVKDANGMETVADYYIGNRKLDNQEAAELQTLIDDLN